MLKLILDQDYARTPPAVDSSSYSHHGRAISTTHHADGTTPGSGALEFTQPDSAVRVVLRPGWLRLRALAVEAVVYPRPAAGRRNLVEGDSSFALFIENDNTLVGSLFTTVDGAPGPSWNVLSSSTHSPDGGAHHVPVDTWCRVVLHYDGITRARLFIDGALVASRSDYRSGLAGVQGAGVVIGNWTLSNRFAFHGLIDRVRIWKDDENATVRQFTSRGLDPAGRDAWDDVWACLTQTLGPEGRERLRDIERIWAEFHRDLIRALQAADSHKREEFLNALATYQRNWRDNTIDDPSHIQALGVVHDYLVAWLGDGWLADLRGFAESLTDRLGAAGRCVDAERLASEDPAFARFIEQALARFT